MALRQWRAALLGRGSCVLGGGCSPKTLLGRPLRTEVSSLLCYPHPLSDTGDDGLAVFSCSLHTERQLLILQKGERETMSQTQGPKAGALYQRAPHFLGPMKEPLQKRDSRALKSHGQAKGL